jgi:uncharacterized membrane protein YccC
LLHWLRKASLRFMWDRAEWRASLLCLPMVALVLAVPIALGRPQMAMAMAAGAVTAGFGSFQRPLYFRGGPMILVSFGIALTAMLGAVTASNTAYLAMAAMVVAFAYGMVGSISASAGWVGLQCCIYLLVSSSVPLRGGDLLDRGLGIVAGGLAQSAVMLALWRFTPPARSTFFTNPDAGPPFLLRDQWRILRRNLTFRSLIFRHGLMLSIAALLSVIVYHWLHFVSGYWIPMTALIVLNPKVHDTTNKAVARIVGTIAGAILASSIAGLLRPQAWVLVVLVTIFVGGAFALQYVNYAAFATALTIYIVFLLAIIKLPEHEVIVHRVWATLIGGAIAMLVHSLSYKAESLIWHQE